MTALWIVLEQLVLVGRLEAAVPELDIGTARAHAAAALAAATDEVPAELLLAMAYVESRFDPSWVSRVELDQGRKIGRWPWTRPPPDLDRRASLFCGPLQTQARSWRECLSHRELDVGYRKAAAELAAWLRDRRVRGDVARALAGYGCGNHGVTTLKCNRYPARVLWMQRRIAAGIPPRAHPALGRAPSS